VASAAKSAYVAAKHGMVGFTKAAALETATTGVTVNAICPGWVLTPLVQKQIDARAAKDGLTAEEAARIALLGEKQPSLQFTTPEQLGELAVFLCSPAPTTCAARPGRWTAAGPFRIVVVDDDARIRDLLRRYCRRKVSTCCWPKTPRR
jgi:3-hydroxybutyrate dehydrogenase